MSSPFPSTAPPVTRHALVVDDSTTMRRSLVMTLEIGGYQVRDARCAEDALSMIRQHRPDIVLTDIVMPGMGGLALIHHIRQHWPGLPVLALTTQTSQAYRDEAMQAGARGWLIKPVGGTELLGLVRQVLAAGG